MIMPLPGSPLCPHSGVSSAPALLGAVSFALTFFLLYLLPWHISCFCLAPALTLCLACPPLPGIPPLALFSWCLPSLLKCLHRGTICSSHCFSFGMQYIYALCCGDKRKRLCLAQGSSWPPPTQVPPVPLHYQTPDSYVQYSNGLLNFLFGWTQAINLSRFFL